MEIHKLLAEGKDIDGRDKFSRTPLHLAAYAGQVDRPSRILNLIQTANTNICSASVFCGGIDFLPGQRERLWTPSYGLLLGQ